MFYNKRDGNWMIGGDLSMSSRCLPSLKTIEIHTARQKSKHVYAASQRIQLCYVPIYTAISPYFEDRESNETPQPRKSASCEKISGRQA